MDIFGGFSAKLRRLGGLVTTLPLNPTKIYRYKFLKVTKNRHGKLAPSDKLYNIVIVILLVAPSAKFDDIKC